MTTQTTTISHLREIAIAELGAADLASEASALDPDGIGDRSSVRAYLFFDRRGNACNALLSIDDQRLGVMWGGQSTWGDHLADPDDLDALEAAIIRSADDETWAR